MKNNIKHLLLCILAIFLSLSAYNQTPDFTGLKIMLNPGHGGHDSDDRGMPNGFWESDGNLTKGLWLRDLLEARGAEVIMSRVLNRTEDDLPLSTIAAMANNNNVDLFIAIHSNAANQSVNYPVTIFNGKTETPSIPEAKVWARVLVEQLILNQATHWTFTTPRYIGDLTLNPSWTNGYGVLWPLQVPGIISEGSFHDYRPEMDRLLNLEYRKQEAYSMLYAMETYFGLAGVEPLGNISGIVRDSLLEKQNYTLPNSPDKYMNVNGATVKLEETGETYLVDSWENGFYMFDSLAPGDYKLVFSAESYFNDTVSVEVLPHKFTYHNHWYNIDTTVSPIVLYTSPTEGEMINCSDPISFTFNMNMDSATVADAFVITPYVAGTFTWDLEHLSVIFQPEIPYETSTNYTATINTSAEQQWGVPLESEVSVSFLTSDRNRFLIDRNFPVSSQTEVSPFLQFRLIFDAPINNTSVIGAVEIIPEEGPVIGTKSGTISEIGGKGHYYFSPAEDLEYNKNYILKLYGTIKDSDNNPLFDTIQIPFSTMEELVDQLILDEFEDDAWIIDFESSINIDPTSFLFKWDKDQRSGSASTLFRAKFLSDDAECVLKPSSGSLGIITYSHDIGLWIWGDLSYNKISIGLNIEPEIELCTIDFAGWKYCMTERPIGATSIKYLKYSKNPAGYDGKDIFLDALSQRQLLGIPKRNIDSEDLAYPNPVIGDKLWIRNINNTPIEYTLYSITGQLLQQGSVSKEQVHIKIGENIKNHSSFIIKVISSEKCYSQIIFNKLK